MSVFDASMEPMVDMFLYETSTLLEQLDQILLDSEQSRTMDEESINEIFRIMHTIKGSAAMMGLTAFSKVAHRTEDMFYIVRDKPDTMQGPLSSPIFDILFQASDFFKSEIEAIQQSVEDYRPKTATDLTNTIDSMIPQLKGEVPIEPKAVETPAASVAAAPAPAAEKPAPAPAVAPAAPVAEKPAESAPAPAASGEAKAHRIRVFFEDDCQMENIRAFMLLTQLKDYCEELTSVPANPESNSACAAEIIKNGFLVCLKTLLPIESIYNVIESSVNIKSYEYVESAPAAPAAPVKSEVKAVASAETKTEVKETVSEHKTEAKAHAGDAKGAGKQSMISVNQTKLNQLMDIMGEIVIAESMVANTPELKNLQLDNFNKSTRQLRKLTDQLQDIVMSIRMVPLTGVFQKMGLIVRDMNRKLGKDVVLKTFGGDTEIDKTINDVLADPFMHMIRNSMDHAIETPEVRAACGKPAKGVITLGAQNIGGEIVITLADDGAGLDRDKILKKAKEKGLLTKNESEYTDKEVYHLIMLAGFSTKDTATEFSGRGVGMDVVRQNIEKVNGTISVESKKGEGTTFTIKIPLTLAIVDGMEVSVSNNIYVIPITSINQTFKLDNDTKLLTDTNGAEMVMVRGVCYPIIRLHKNYEIEDAVTDLQEGIFILVTSGNKSACLFVDKLLGEQQVVVKPFPSYLSKYNLKSNGFAGCTIMGDGSISLILDANNLLNNF